MNPALAMPQGFGIPDITGLLALPGLPSERQAKRFAGSLEEMIRGVSSLLDELVVRAIEKRTVAEFEAVRKEVFPNYFVAVRALSDLASITVPRHVIEVLTNEHFSEMEADFRDRGLTAFGAEVRDQAIFTAWTLRKISDLCEMIEKSKISSRLKKTDREMCTNFAYYAIWTRFHLDCLLKSMQLQKPIYPEVLVEVIDGLRAAVNAYTWARRGLDLRTASAEPAVAAIEWDAEEQQLLDEATHDVLTEPA